MTRALPYLYLALAIAFEVVGTSALKASETLTRLVPSLVTLVAYTASFVFLLTDDDLTAINGRREELEGKIQERYGIAKDQARKDVDAWFTAQNF